MSAELSLPASPQKPRRRRVRLQTVVVVFLGNATLVLLPYWVSPFARLFRDLDVRPGRFALPLLAEYLIFSHWPFWAILSAIFTAIAVTKDLVVPPAHVSAANAVLGVALSLLVFAAWSLIVSGLRSLAG